jgi:hypothetical protein
MVTPWARFDGLNGLKLHVQRVPCSLEIVSTPLGAPEAEDPELGVELDELQAASAAASSPDARTAPALVVLLIASTSLRRCDMRLL